MERRTCSDFIAKVTGLTNTVQQHCTSSFSDKGRLKCKPSFSQGEGYHNCEYRFCSGLWKDLTAACVNVGRQGLAVPIGAILCCHMQGTALQYLVT